MNPDGLILLVCGGRDYPNRANVFRVLDRVHAKQPIACIVHGACSERYNPSALRGADRWAEEWAKDREVSYRGYPAPWKTRGRAAGMWRNGEMLRREGATLSGVVAFAGGSGTEGMCAIASRAGLRVRVADHDGNLREWSEP